MLGLHHAIDHAAARAFVLQRDGKSKEATKLYQRDVGFPITNELSTPLDRALTTERQRLGQNSCKELAMLSPCG